MRKKLRKNVLVAKVMRAMFDDSDHYAVLTTMKIKDKLEQGMSIDCGKVDEMIAGERMDRYERGQNVIQNKDI